MSNIAIGFKQIMPGDGWYAFHNDGSKKVRSPILWGLTEEGKVLPLIVHKDGSAAHYIADEQNEISYIRSDYWSTGNVGLDG